MNILDILSYGYGIFFVALQSALVFGFVLERMRDRRALGAPEAPGETAPDGGNPKVSVIIPIHNEAGRMEGLLQSLLKQDCPAEIIFVDDRSDDESPAMLAEFAKNAPALGLGDCKVVTLAENPGPNRKQHALAVGIAEARGDFLLFTDGDCEMPPGWIRAMVGRISGGKVGALIGPVFKKKPGRGLFFLYQCYDHAIRYNYLAGAVGLGAAGGGFGNNLIVSRAALDAAGGYRAVPPSPTEDAALISLIRSHGRYRIRAAAMPDAAVETCAEETWRGFASQTLRWNNGGLFSPDPATRLGYNLLMLLITAGAFAVPLLPFLPGLWPLPAAGLVVMIQNTIVTFAFFRQKLPKGGFLNLGYLCTLLFAQPYFTLMTIMGYCGIRASWKGGTWGWGNRR
ncbi:MAG: glycosyltransferase [Treponema sp.]|nr:glycosyltransferase [Treponema sp.]